MFSFLAVDDSGVEIRVSAYGDIACRTASLIYLEQVSKFFVCPEQVINTFIV